MAARIHRAFAADAIGVLQARAILLLYICGGIQRDEVADMNLIFVCTCKRDVSLPDDAAARIQTVADAMRLVIKNRPVDSA